jgi:hypothetical protein
MGVRASRTMGASVPDKSKCPLCKKVGLVRVETVIKGGTATRVCYCGGCGGSWEEADQQAAEPLARGDRPDRSRS